MEPLILQETQATPKVVFDKKNERMEISGNSLPEDVMTFYNLLVNWLQEYVKDPNPHTIMDIRLYYFNSSSSKVMVDVIAPLEALVKKGLKVEINWYYLEVDEDMLSTGKEYEEMFNIPFNFISYMQ
jgi:hypothetical protein